MRPRERLWHSGVEALESREILALLLRTGTRSVSALALADRLLARFHSLEGVLLASLEELTSVPGVGPAKASQIKAAYEAGRRLQRPREKDVPIRSAADAVAYVMPKLRLLQHEEVWLILLDVKYRVIGLHQVSVGHLSGAPVHPREFFKEAIRRSSYAVIMVHNHPSGDLAPSPDDLALTDRLRQAGDLLGIELLDHIIVAENDYLSFKEHGYW